MATNVVDYYGPHDATFYQCLASRGIHGIARYLTTTLTDLREITPEEVRLAHDAGLSIFFVYEMNSTYPGYFTFAQGAEDCRQAMQRLADLGAPDGTVVYFAVDVNIEPSITDAYFNGVESAVTPRIVPGAYGYQRLCEYARANFPNVGKHLWQTYGTPTVPLDLWQHLQEIMCGVEVDLNDCSVEGWTMETPEETYARIAPLLQAKIVAPQENTNQAIKDALGLIAAHQSVNVGDLAAGVTARVLRALEAVLTNTVPPVPPSAPAGTKYFGESADGSAVGWTWPNGETHYYVDGVDRG